ncbi:MAG: Modification methylase DpnIIB [Alphaproteobacteria bacterium MarineAlpha5_Bin11]|nr:MAG: Modification methylase DpnIIB [Alphaproteobacteria bacterium MarineAlpha5_Bin11]PPR52225.1 MAG: Modification methylase DpnIIB [Alphaproteobacteria bacterium MarineAlpha5_Bin10]
MMEAMPDKSVDCIFADPPYNLQLKDTLLRPDQTSVDAVDDEWDKFKSYKEYDSFTLKWLSQSKRLLKDGGALWVIGSYHNILRIGSKIQDLNMWILNDIIWQKTNPMPNFRGTRFTNAHETLLWCTTSRNSKYTFNYQNMKVFNEDKQMRSDWQIPICSGKERIRHKDNARAHPTQKPEALLYRVILSSTNVNDLILDPFLGSGTTAVVAKKLGRNFVGIEKDKNYFEIAKTRIKKTKTYEKDIIKIEKSRKHLPRIPFGELVEQGIIPPGAILSDKKNMFRAKVKVDGSIVSKNHQGSIHKVGASIQGLPSCNGWDYWHLHKENRILLIDEIRSDYRNKKT